VSSLTDVLHSSSGLGNRQSPTGIVVWGTVSRTGPSRAGAPGSCRRDHNWCRKVPLSLAGWPCFRPPMRSMTKVCDQL